MKSEQVGEFIGDAAVRQHARAALPVSASAVISVAFRIAVAKHALTSQGTWKLDSAEQSFCPDYSHFISLYDAHPIQYFNDKHVEQKKLD